MGFYYGYSVAILTADPASRSVLFQWSGTTYSVTWPADQLVGTFLQPVHMAHPTTVTRTAGARGMLFISEAACSAMNPPLPIAFGVQFSQEMYHTESCTVVSSGGQLGRVYLDRQRVYLSFDWADRTQSWLGASSTLALDTNGFPRGGAAGYLNITNTHLGTVPTFGPKWPDGLAEPDPGAYYDAQGVVDSVSGPQVSLVVTIEAGAVLFTPKPVLLSPAMFYPESRREMMTNVDGWKVPATLGLPIVYPDPKEIGMPFDTANVSGKLKLLKAWVKKCKADGVLVPAPPPPA